MEIFLLITLMFQNGKIVQENTTITHMFTIDKYQEFGRILKLDCIDKSKS